MFILMYFGLEFIVLIKKKNAKPSPPETDEYVTVGGNSIGQIYM